MSFDWTAAFASAIAILIIIAFAGLLALMVSFFFWLEEKTGIPLFLSISVFFLMVVFILGGLGVFS